MHNHVCQPHCDHNRLDEATYKDLIKDVTKNNVPGAIVNNLPHRDWAPLVKHVRYVERKGDTFKFFIPNRHNGWEAYVQFVEWDDVLEDSGYNAVESARLLLWAGNIRLHCTCPSYLYWGYKYILTQKDAAIETEDRFPKIKNPQELGVCCKHLAKVLKTLAFHSGTIAREIKTEKSVRDALAASSFRVPQQNPDK